MMMNKDLHSNRKRIRIMWKDQNMVVGNSKTIRIDMRVWTGIKDMTNIQE